MTTAPLPGSRYRARTRMTPAEIACKLAGHDVGPIPWRGRCGAFDWHADFSLGRECQRCLRAETRLHCTYCHTQALAGHVEVFDYEQDGLPIEQMAKAHMPLSKENA